MHLATLDGSRYTVVPGSRFSLKTLGEVVAYASLSAAQLARAVADSPPDAADFAAGSPAPAYEADLFRARRSKAEPLIAEGLSNAAYHLRRCIDHCRYTSSGIVRDLKNHPEHRPPLPRLTHAQYAALDKINRGGARRYAHLRGSRSIRADDGSTVHPTPFALLEKHRLVRVDTQGASLGAQGITVTAAGKFVLEIQRPTAKPPRVPGTVATRDKPDVRRR
ncbi:hypothetical protein [Streptomyces alkaliphilus]|uniref:hypothetical protein n=1 Tax=Streptomyces alkaliphilus TaxID=1472722 RepID=UPI0015FAF829|nr:hypothetical protein [Streptomyces alkaliphilus]